MLSIDQDSSSMIPAGNQFPKEERLCSKIEIERLFKSGQSFFVHPFKVIYLKSKTPQPSLPKMLVAVSKKKHKRAVARNSIKRKTKEAYRLHRKNAFLSKINSQGNFYFYSLCLVYTSSEDLPYAAIEKAVLKILRQLINTWRNLLPIMSNKTKKKRTIWGLRITAFVALFLALMSFNKPDDQKYFEINRNLTIFSDVFKEINRSYVDEVNINRLMQTSIDEMLGSLDPYTNYIPEDQIEDYRTMTTGQYGGIGAIIGTRNGNTTILMPYEGFPANKAGLQIGDIILKIDEVDLNDKNTSEVSKLLKGQAGTSLDLLIKRFGEKEPKKIQLTRERIKIDNVPYYGMVTEDIGYLQLSDFTQNASDEVKNAITSLKEEGAEKIIFDLRGNPGGLLNEAIDISNLFIPKGKEVVSTRSKVDDWNKSYKALNAPLDTEIPLVILLNGRSASASEIVSGVLQDYDRAVLVGRRSFGKGLVQATRPLSYNSQLKVTIAKYYIPSGRCIQAIDYSNKGKKVPDSLRAEFQTANGRKVYDGKGVRPDITVRLPTVSPIGTSLVSKGLLFEYANKYYSENKRIAPAKEFHLSDKEYQDFTTWLKDKEYDYTTSVEKEINDLVASAKKEKYYEKMKDELELISQRAGHNKENDLQIHKEEIMEMLEEEIVSRYYLNKGIKESTFDNDPDVQEAIAVLNDMDRYKGILSGAIIPEEVDEQEEEIEEALEELELKEIEED